MKYLIISDAASMHIYNFIKNTLMGRGYEIFVLRHSVCDIPEQYEKFYKENNITVFSSGKASGKRNRLQTMLRFIRKCLFLMRLGKVDVCHIHYVHRSSCKLYTLFRHNFGKLILSFWGTDILNPPPKEAEAQKKIIRYADAITVTVEHTKKVFLKRFGKSSQEKLYFGRFASGALSFIKQYSQKFSRKECRETTGVPEGKICIVCGYNANPAQHQDLILDEIKLLSKECKNRIHLIVPMQYDVRNTGYVEIVKRKALTCGCSYEVLENYVPFERNAILSLATDIYMNLRDTDAFSNAMKEQVYSGSIMIQGSWLVYEELDKIKAPVIKVASINGLHKVVASIIDNYIIPEEITLFEPLYDIFSIEAARRSWDYVYRQLGLM